tara:strand:- start:10011 stop:10319 length:309 start_codon:yes stop_codon:yes gene_type:complete
LAGLSSGFAEGSISLTSFFSSGVIFCSVAVAEVCVSAAVLRSAGEIVSNFSSARLGSSFLLSTCSALEMLFFDASLFLKVAAGRIYWDTLFRDSDFFFLHQN